MADRDSEMEEVRNYILKMAKETGLNDGWIDPCLVLLEEAVKVDHLQKYVKFKCIGSSKESVLFEGLVFTKTPIYELELSKDKLSLLLWKGCLDMEEEEKDTASHNFSTVESSGANIVLVEKTISKAYEEYLAESETLAVSDMKHRLERFPNFGFGCTSWRCEKFIEDLNSPKTEKGLMYFGGCGSLTILLHGYCTRDLKLMKRLLKSGYNRFRNIRLSSTYHLVAMPPLKLTAWKMAEIQHPEVIEDEISTVIAFALWQKTQNEPSKSNPKIDVHCLYEDNFSHLRENCSITEEQYIRSLGRCDKWDAKGGKSGAVFAMTKDKRFIIKEIQYVEYQSFDTFASRYFDYLKEALDTSQKTCLAKIFGIYQVTLDTQKYLIVMENVVFNRNLSTQFDLKGVHGRLAIESAQVLLDENLINKQKKLPLQISYSSEVNFEEAIRNDTNFLSGVNVMDYSLLMGVDTENEELVCGIIDYLVPYSWKKKAESMGKSALLVGKGTRPTVISPEEYKERFINFMQDMFLGKTVLRERVKRLEGQLMIERKATLVAQEQVERLKKRLGEE